MEQRGVSGLGPRGVASGDPGGLAPGDTECAPGPARSPGEVAPGSAGARPATGDARVDEAVARLADLAELPVAEHPAVFGYVHERLTEALGDLDVRDPAGPGHEPDPGAPGG
jgi:hypothetical protein